MANISIVPFHGAKLITTQVNDIVYVAMKPIVEAIGLDWKSQSRKLQKTQQKYGCGHMTIPTKSGNQSMIFLPLRKLNGWLFSINPQKVRADLREKVIQYQEECFEVLYKHFMPQAAQPNTITPEQQFIIREAVDRLHRNTGQPHQSIYRGLHRKFRISKYEQLPASQFEEALKFLTGATTLIYADDIMDDVTHADMKNISALCERVLYISAWWNQYGAAIGKLNRNMHNSLVNYFDDAARSACHLASRYGLGMVSMDYLKNYPFAESSEEKHRYHAVWESIHNPKNTQYLGTRNRNPRQAALSK